MFASVRRASPRIVFTTRARRWVRLSSTGCRERGGAAQVYTSRMLAILLYGAAFLLYGALAFHFWRTRWLGSRAPRIARWERTAVVLPLALHTWLIYDMLLASPSSASAHTTELRLHLVLAMIAYGMFTIAALHALLMTVMEKRLHGGALAGPLAALPPLLTMERLLFRVILAGFVFLTLTLVTGIAFSETLFGRAMKFDHKTVFAISSWFIFAALLAGRYFYGWRGRTALRWTLAGFLALLLAYVGSRFVLEVVLRRGMA